MNLLIKTSRIWSMWLGFQLTIASVALGQADDLLVGIWSADEGFQIVDFLFRSDGRYQLDTRSTDPVLDFSSSERGRYAISGPTLILTPYDYLGEPQGVHYEFQVIGGSLTLTRPEFGISQVYQFKTGSRADVLAREQVDPDLVRTWERTIPFFGKAEYTFRPGGYYLLKNTPDDSPFPPELIRGRYEQDGTRLMLNPYGGVEAEYEIDIFGSTLTLIKQDTFSGESATYEAIPGSDAEVRAKAAEAAAVLAHEYWHVGVWEIRDAIQTVDLTIRPDGHYMAQEETEFLQGTVRGRYTLAPGEIHFSPFVGQGLYARSNGEFGKVARTRALDYYDGELQFIDLEAISQSVTIARKRPGSEALVLERAHQARVEREREGWHLGIWEVQDPAGWMEFTFRPDHRYLAKSGTDGVPSQVERGRYVVAADKVTLAPYAGLGAPRGFELDLYDGDLFLIGDLTRMVVARKVPNSEAEVMAKTHQPEALEGELGSILGLWTARLPGESVELVFRQDGQFRSSRCQNQAISRDYGLYSVDLQSRTMVFDSRFVEVQSLGLDFYGDTLTTFGGLGPPTTYTVNLGFAEAAIAASHAADAVEAEIDGAWLARVPIGPRDPNAVQVPTAQIPADPNPGAIFEAPTVLAHYQLYRRLIPGLVFFNVQGTIESVPVVNTREWHFFPTGRVLVRFQNHRAGVFPNTVIDVTDNWGAYAIGPKPTQTDILHLYADHAVFIETDLGETAELTLEDGRRHLFWTKDFQALSEWAAERQPIPCEAPANANPSLMNTGLSLSTSIEPDDIPVPGPIRIQLTGPDAGLYTIRGTTEGAVNLVVERAGGLDSPGAWHSVLTNHVPGGPFVLLVPQDAQAAGYYRVRAAVGSAND